MAHYEDLTIDQGSDIAIELRLINKDGTKKNLNGYSIAAKLAPNFAATDSDKIAFTSIITSPDSDGIVNLSLTNTQTDLLNTKKRYVYDVELSFIDSDGITIKERVLEGLLNVTPSVTK
jgi:hypothetical protein